ncbi:MAG: glycosyltransferase [Rhizobiaceae bacterium]|nr:MAG: glycosyltransferase [Rhizobiaceae bacterium]
MDGERRIGGSPAARSSGACWLDEVNDAADMRDIPRKQGEILPARRRALADRLEIVRDYLGRTLPMEPRVPASADGGQAEPVYDARLPGGRALPVGHYRASIQIEDGATVMRSPILQVFSFHTARDRSIVLRNTGAAGGDILGCDVAFVGDAVALRLVPDAGGREIRCGPLHLRRLTRLEFYGKLLRKAFSSARRQETSARTVLGGLLHTLRTRGLRALAADLRRIDQLSPQAAYAVWIEAYERLETEKRTFSRLVAASSAALPTVSLVMVVEDGDAGHLATAIASVVDQVHPSWELIVVLAASASAAARAAVEEARGRDQRIRSIETAPGTDLAACRNAALGLASGAWVAPLGAADRLAPTALAAVVLDAAASPEAWLIYADDDSLDECGGRRLPRFKPDFSRELLRSHDYMGDLLFVRTDLVRSLGGWRPGLGYAHDYDLALRAYEQIGGGGIRHIAKVLHHRAAARSDARKVEAMRRALREHLARTGTVAGVDVVQGIAALRLRHALPKPVPMVSLIVPTRDKVHLLRSCVESILKLTAYDNYEILVVDNGSTDTAAVAYLAELAGRDRVRVLSYRQSFNFSRINNFAVREAGGSIIGLVNNDTVAITPDWLGEMVAWAVQPDIGCVGAKLYYGDDTIQHAGIVLGIGDVAGHVHRHSPRTDTGYCDRLKLVQNFSAVTAACLIVRKAVYEEVGGLNEHDLTVAYNDVDFCLKVREAGYANVWTPFAELYHLESLSRGSDRTSLKAKRYASEVSYMHRRWDLSVDPFYSPHLTRLREDFSIAV